MEKTIFFIVFAFYMVSCDYSGKNPHMAVRSFRDFVVPDSIHEELIAAVFLQDDAHQVLLYSDTSFREGLKISYRNDSMLSAERMTVLKFNEFRSMPAKLDYVISSNQVLMFPSSGVCTEMNGVSGGICFARVDSNRPEKRSAPQFIEFR